ncbi:MAG: HNH endonuclease [Sphingomonadales bacterium]|nr:HNH endonuclease [Sphingomonadales bacterium]
MARRKWTDDDYAALEADEAAPAEPCWLCGRPLGETIDRHHPVPKSKGGKGGQVQMHPICHATLHLNFTNAQLAKIGDDVERYRAEPEMAKFLAWVADKDPDFYVRTAKAGDKGRRGR